MSNTSTSECSLQLYSSMNGRDSIWFYCMRMYAIWLIQIILILREQQHHQNIRQQARNTRNMEKGDKRSSSGQAEPSVKRRKRITKPSLPTETSTSEPI